MPDLHPFEESLVADWPIRGWCDRTLLVAVSGGADSVALLRSLVRIRETQPACVEGRLIAAHFNHGWRGAESDGDARFVRSLARELGVPVIVGRARARRAEVSPAAPNRSEEAARNIRYRFLTDVAAQVGARYVVTAHTANDQVETMLQRILRGTGLAGLSGIPRVRRISTATTLIRPMLTATRASVVKYLSYLSQAYREDSSNVSGTYTRNRIRGELLPLARELYGDVDSALLRLGYLAQEAQEVIQNRVKELSEHAVVEHSPQKLVLRTSHLRNAEPYLSRETLRSLWRQQRWPAQGMGSAQWNALASLLAAHPADNEIRIHTFPGNVSAKKQGELLTLTRPVFITRS